MMLVVNVNVMAYVLLTFTIVQDGAITDQRPKYQGLTHAFRTIYKQDSFFGLYRVN